MPVVFRLFICLMKQMREEDAFREREHVVKLRRKIYKEYGL